MEDKKSKIKGLVTTILIHGILIVFLCMYTFSAPKVEFPEPNGIEVNFGELIVGDDVPGEPISQTEVIPQENTPSVTDNSVVTQQDGPVSIKQNETKIKETKPELTPEEKALNDWKQRQQALANQNLNNSTAGNGGTNTGPWGNGGTQQGGTPGHPNGTPNVKNTKGNPGNPFGNGDATYSPKPENTTGCTRNVVLKASINPSGKVIKVEVIMGTTESNQDCVEAAKNALKRWTFPTKETNDTRYAEITFRFDLH